MADDGTTHPMPLGRREALGLLLALGALSYWLVIAASAYDVSGSGNGALGTFGGFDGGSRIEIMAKFLAGSATFQFLPFLVGAVVLATARPWSSSGASAKAALAILFPLGLVLGATAAYGAFLVAVDGDGGSISFGLDGQTGPSRAAAGVMYIVTSLGAMYVAWCAFGRLPFATTPPTAPSPESVPDAAFAPPSASGPGPGGGSAGTDPWGPDPTGPGATPTGPV